MESIESPEILNIGNSVANLIINDNANDKSRNSPEPMDCDDTVYAIPESMEVGDHRRNRVNTNNLKDTERNVAKANAYKKVRKCNLLLQSTEMDKAFNKDKKHTRYSPEPMDCDDSHTVDAIPESMGGYPRYPHNQNLTELRSEDLTVLPHALQIDGKLFMESVMNLLSTAFPVSNAHPDSEPVVDGILASRNKFYIDNREVQERYRYFEDYMIWCQNDKGFPGVLFDIYCPLIGYYFHLTPFCEFSDGLILIRDGLYYLPFKDVKDDINISIGDITKPTCPNWEIMWPISDSEGHAVLFSVNSKGKTYLLNSGPVTDEDRRKGKQLSKCFRLWFAKPVKFEAKPMKYQQPPNSYYCVLYVAHCITYKIINWSKYKNVSKPDTKPDTKLMKEIFRWILKHLKEHQVRLCLEIGIEKSRLGNSRDLYIFFMSCFSRSEKG